MDIVDYHGNPFIVRSPWISKRTIEPLKMDFFAQPTKPKINLNKEFNLTGKSAIEYLKNPIVMEQLAKYHSDKMSGLF